MAYFCACLLLTPPSLSFLSSPYEHGHHVACVPFDAPPFPIKDIVDLQSADIYLEENRSHPQSNTQR